MRSDRNAPSRADAATAAVGIQVERELLPSALAYVGCCRAVVGSCDGAHVIASVTKIGLMTNPTGVN